MLLGEANASIVAGDTNPSANYKRAVMRAPPSRFMVEFLPTNKSNGAYHHGMHISPAMTSDSASVSTRSSGVEYDIWRRWEDCLWFQDILEQEYKRAAREKKTRLQQGKGVKGFNGMYKQDMASSWESLPPGPDPNAVAQDIHAYLPSLTKKGTLFRASQATIDTRQKEITNLIETLFSDSMPALIQEIRASTVVTDFFALWRRDYDHMDRAPKYSRSSVSSSVFSSYFSESTASLDTRSSKSSRSSNSNDTINARSNHLSPARDHLHPRAYAGERPRSISSASDITDTTHYPRSRRSSGGSVDTLEPMKNRRRRPVSSASSDSSISTHSDGSSDSSSTSATSPSIVEEPPYVFGHNPNLSSERPHSVLEVLPEEREMLSKGSDSLVPPPRRSRASPTERRANRMTQVLGLPPSTTRPASRNVRDSWATITSIDTRADQIMEGLGFSLPNPIKDNKFRQSMASISTFMTTDSADAVFPHDVPDAYDDADADAPSPTRSHSSAPRVSTALTLSDFEIYSECGEDDDVFSTNDTESMLDRRSFLDARSILEGFPRPTSYLPETYRDAISERSETPTGLQYLQSLRIDEEPSFSSDLPPSPTGTTFSDSTFNAPPSPTSTVFSSFTSYSTSTTSSASPGTSLSLKVAYGTTIVLLRVARETSLAEVRQRAYNKLVGQEGVPLAPEFALAFAAAAPLSPVKAQQQRKRTVSAGSAASDGSGVATADLQPVRSEEEWRQIVSTFSGGKMSLRITDAE